MTTMAMDDRVQLKREEVVGNEVVLTDINPKTNTISIDDPVSGDSLNKIIERLWNAINNKLSRIVNSVNGRTGVVVLDATDVGLGNVDNVSLADIKKWVIERTIQEFHNKRIELFDSLEDVDDALTQWNNDEAFVDKPYYSHHGYKRDGDMRGYIGYIYQDPATGSLHHTFDMVIDTVGWTDNSIIYNENLGKDKDFHGGGIGVNIWKYEEALEIYNSASGKTNSGLRIDGSKIVPKVYFFDGVYGNGDPNDQNALLYFDQDTLPNPLPKTVTIKIDGFDMTYHKPIYSKPGIITKLEDWTPNFIRQSFKIGDIIICNFRSDKYAKKTDCSIELIHKYMNPLLMFRNTAIGQVTQAPTLEHPGSNYTIEFYTLRPNLYKGLKEYEVNTKMAYAKNGKAIGVSLLEHSMRPADYPRGFNMSGINALEPYNIEYSKTKSTDKPERLIRIITPTGPEPILVDDTSSAMYISPNYSMCTFPHELYDSDYNDGVPIKNWPPDVPLNFPDPTMDDNCELKSYLGVNLLKSFNLADHYAINRSGLRINSSYKTLTGNWFGQPDNHEEFTMSHSGGLSVNVGKFLEIGSEPKYELEKKTPDNYYEDGKVNVRIDPKKSLYNSGSNRLGVRLIKKVSNNKPSGGLIHASDDNLNKDYGIAVNGGMGIKFSRYNRMGRVLDNDEPNTLGVNIKDFLNTEDVNENWGPYGGLRFVIDDGSYGSFLSVRVNEDDTWFDEAAGHNKPNKVYQVGSEGLRITDRNVLGIQLQHDGLDTDEYGNSDNPLYIKSDKEWLISTFYRKGFEPPKKLINVFGSLDTVLSPNPNYIYFLNDGINRDYYFYHIEGDNGKWIKILNFYDSIDNLPGADDEDTTAVNKLFIVNDKFRSVKPTKVLRWRGSEYEELTDWMDRPISGLKFEYNRQKGLYTETSDLFNTRKLAVNIYDKSTLINDDREFDNKYLGGLRFSQNGTIAIRLNTSNIDNTVGTKGLCIDGSNVLGVKIDKSRSDLDIDDEGNLIISDTFKDGLVKEQQPLIISSGDSSITYNGTETIEIELGPGLRFVDEAAYNRVKAELLAILDGDLTTWDYWLMYKQKSGIVSYALKNVIKIYTDLRSDVENDVNSIETLENIINVWNQVLALPHPDNADWNACEDIWLTWSLNDILEITKGLIEYLNEFNNERYKEIINWFNGYYKDDTAEHISESNSVSEVIEHFVGRGFPLNQLVGFLDRYRKYIYEAGLRPNPYKDELLTILDSEELTTWDKWKITTTLGISDFSITGHIKFFNKLKMDISNDALSTAGLEEYVKLFKEVMASPEPVQDTGTFKDWNMQKDIWLTWSLDKIWHTARNLIQYMYDNDPTLYQSKIIDYSKLHGYDFSGKSVSEVIDYVINNKDLNISYTIFLLAKCLDYITENNLTPNSSAILRTQVLNFIDDSTLWVKWNVFKSEITSENTSISSVNNALSKLRNDVFADVVTEERLDLYAKAFDEANKLPLPNAAQTDYQNTIWAKWTFKKLLNTGSEFITYLYKYDKEEYKRQVVDKYKQDYDVDLTAETLDTVIDKFTNNTMSLPDFVKFVGTNMGYIFGAGILSFPEESKDLEEVEPSTPTPPSEGEGD